MNYEQAQLLHAAAMNDPCYQSLLEECRKLELEYLRILRKLPERDRDILERYISLCEELEYRKTCLAIADESDAKRSFICISVP
jgi:hypothetical protein